YGVRVHGDRAGRGPRPAGAVRARPRADPAAPGLPGDGVTLRAQVAVLVAGLIWAAVAAAADSTDPKGALTKADQVYASSSTLRFTDLGPAWAGGAEKPSSLKIPVCPSNQPNNSDLTITGHAESRLTLDSAAIQVDTDVLVFKNAGQVSKLVKRIILNPSVSDCLRYDLIKSVG